jgi:hypothetical protein
MEPGAAVCALAWLAEIASAIRPAEIRNPVLDMVLDIMAPRSLSGCEQRHSNAMNAP